MMKQLALTAVTKASVAFLNVLIHVTIGYVVYNFILLLR